MQFSVSFEVITVMHKGTDLSM